MAKQKSMMTAQEDLIEQIGDVLKTDLGFLHKLAPRELGILATSLKDFVDREKAASENNRLRFIDRT